MSCNGLGGLWRLAETQRSKSIYGLRAAIIASPLPLLILGIAALFAAKTNAELLCRQTLSGDQYSSRASKGLQISVLSHKTTVNSVKDAAMISFVMTYAILFVNGLLNNMVVGVVIVSKDIWTSA